jgi:spore coat polysaccharide biosynthesis protein SpsF (cytidylyltransferase family)
MKRPRVVCVVQARMTSTRLPGKVLLPLGGRPVLDHVVTRCRRARRVDEVVVAAPDLPSSVPIEEACARMGVRFVGGPEHDVLERYLVAVEVTSADVVVRVTSDCPLIDPVFIEVCLSEFLASATTDAPYDYFCNVEPRRLPRGLDVEVFTAAALRTAASDATSSVEREHVTATLRTSGKFRTGGLLLNRDFSDLRWTLDTPEDLAMFERLFAAADGELDFATALALVRSEPSIAALNAQVEQKTT